jgi:hypothetical protein
MKIIIYLNEEKTSTHVINTSKEFDLEARRKPDHIKEVVQTVCPNYKSFEAKKDEI